MWFRGVCFSLTLALILLLLLLLQTTVREVMSSPPVACKADATVRGELQLLVSLPTAHQWQLCTNYSRSTAEPVCPPGVGFVPAVSP